MTLRLFMLLLAALPAMTSAETQHVLTPSVLRQLGSGTQKQTADEDKSFSRNCLEVRRLVGAHEFAFMCRWDDGTVSLIKIAQGFDLTGTYPVGHDPQTGTALSDLTSLAAISQTVQTFALIKAANPSSAAKLVISGSFSKLPANKGEPVATNATLILE